MSVRILGGSLRGRRLGVAAGVRPTEAKVREALVAIWGDRLPESRVLDLFAGSGAMGLEALSRGACRATFVESSPRALGHLRRACEDLVPGRYEILRLRLPGGLAREPELGHDLIFADPPYGFEAFEELLGLLRPWAVEGALAAVEHSRRKEPAVPTDGWRLLERRRYGESALTLLEALPEGPSRS